MKLPVAMVSFPPSDMASRALIARLTSAAESWLLSTNAGQASPLRVGLDFDVPAENRRQQSHGFADEFVDVDFGRLQRLLAGERQQADGEICPPVGRIADQLGDRRQVRNILDAVGQDFDRTRDHGQHVVEVMGDAAGQLPERFHLQRLDQSRFGGTLLGNVPDKGVDDVTVTTSQRRERHFDEKLVTVAVQGRSLIAHAHRAAGGLAQELRDALPVRQREAAPETPAPRA